MLSFRFELAFRCNWCALFVHLAVRSYFVMHSLAMEPILSEDCLEFERWLPLRYLYDWRMFASLANHANRRSGERFSPEHPRFDAMFDSFKGRLDAYVDEVFSQDGDREPVILTLLSSERRTRQARYLRDH